MQRTFSVKIDDQAITALDILAESQNTTRNALVVDAIHQIIDGGVSKAFEKKIEYVLSKYLGFSSREGFDSAVESQFGVMLVDLIDARLKVLYGIPPDTELKDGCLLQLQTTIETQQEVPKILPFTGGMTERALRHLMDKLKLDEYVTLDSLSGTLSVSKIAVAADLARLGIKAERRRVNGARIRIYSKDQLSTIEAALTSISKDSQVQSSG